MARNSLLMKPSAWAPLVMSGLALLLVVAVFATSGVTRPPDERAPARLFQLLILLQVPIAGWFLFRWLPRRPVLGLGVLTLQIVLAAAAVTVVLVLEAA